MLAGNGGPPRGGSPALGIQPKTPAFSIPAEPHLYRIGRVSPLLSTRSKVPAMVTTLLLAALAVVSLSFALLIVPILLLQRFVPRDSALDEVEESWIRRYGD